MIADYLDNPASQEIWFTAVENVVPIAIGFCAPEMFTEGTYNLYAIGVSKESQAKGLGRRMMTYVEEVVEKQHLGES